MLTCGIEMTNASAVSDFFFSNVRQIFVLPYCVALKKKINNIFPHSQTSINSVSWQMKIFTRAGERNQLGADRQTPLPGSVSGAIFTLKSRHNRGFVIG